LQGVAQLCHFAQNQARTPEACAAEQDQEQGAIANDPQASAQTFSFRQPAEDQIKGLSRGHNVGGWRAGGGKFGREVLVSAKIEIHLGLHPGLVKIHNLQTYESEFHLAFALVHAGNFAQADLRGYDNVGIEIIYEAEERLRPRR
jgi:hypothetical protein